MLKYDAMVQDTGETLNVTKKLVLEIISSPSLFCLSFAFPDDGSIVSKLLVVSTVVSDKQYFALVYVSVLKDDTTVVFYESVLDLNESISGAALDALENGLIISCPVLA